MGDIIDTIGLQGTKTSKKVQALFDTGADIGRVTKSLADELGLMLFAKGQKMILPNSQEVSTDIVGGMADIKGCKFPILFALMDKEEPPVSVGTWAMQSMGIKLDPQNETYTIRCNIPKL